MIVTIVWFKPNKFYTSEEVKMPSDLKAWEFGEWLSKHPTDIATMLAVTEGETPWGFPAIRTPANWNHS